MKTNVTKAATVKATKTAKAEKVLAPKPEKVTKAAKPAKATKPQTVVLTPAENCPFGYPKQGGKCAAVWRLVEKVLETGKVPTGQEIWAIAQAENENGKQPPHNLSNVMQETLRCRRYYGFGGRRK